jgi:cysteine desulfurase
MEVYLDYAATTPLDPAVLAAMLPHMESVYGNPSSLHAYGRAAKVAIEKARRTVAELLHVSPSEIFFTSGGTEGNNLALAGAVEKLGIRHIITSPLEHLSVLEVVQRLAATHAIQLHYVEVDTHGQVQHAHLETLLGQHSSVLVSLMHANNEIGNLNDLVRIGELCRKYKAFFHTDAVQTLGCYELNLSQLPIDILVGTGHKLYGPKGIGIMYINSRFAIAPQIVGGGQERGMRAGTENVPAIVGMSHALVLAYRDMQAHRQAAEQLKKQMMQALEEAIPSVDFCGMSNDFSHSLYNLLSVHLPPYAGEEMVLFNLDIKHVAASAGSACTSGTQKRSHVIEALYPSLLGAVLRFSFGKHNTAAEISYAVQQLAGIFHASY